MLFGILIGFCGLPILYMVIYAIKPLFPKNAKWTIYIWLNLKRLTPIESCYRWDDNKDKYFLLKKKQKNYVVSFMHSWLYHIYEGSTAKELQHKYDMGGQSNKADYLKFWEKGIGKKIEKWYNNL